MPAISRPIVWEARFKQETKPRKIHSSPTLQQKGFDMNFASPSRNEPQGNPSQPELRPTRYRRLLPREEKKDHPIGNTGELSYFLRETGPFSEEDHENSRRVSAPNKLVKRVFRSSQNVANAPSPAVQANEISKYFKPRGTVQRTSLAGM